MPIYEIELDDGRRFHVDADSHEAALSGLQRHIGTGRPQPQQPSAPRPWQSFDVAGARSAGYSDSDILEHLANSGRVPFDVAGARSTGYTDTDILDHISSRFAATPKPNTNIFSAPQHGLASAVTGFGKTLEHYTPFQDAAKTVEQAGANLAPRNYQPARIVNDDWSVNASEAPRAIAEAAPAMGAGLVAARLLARLTPMGRMASAVAGAGGLLAATQLGQRAEDRAATRTGEQGAAPSMSDKAVAAAAMVPEALLQGIGAKRFLPGAVRPTAVGASGVAEAASNLGRTAAVEGVTQGAQNLVEQTGRTIGTEKGLSINPVEAANAAASGAATGATFAAKRAVRDARDAVRFRDIDLDTAGAVANDIANSSERSLAKPREGFKAVRATDTNYRADLELLEPRFREEAKIDTGEVNGILARVMAGEKLTARDFNILENVAEGTKHGPQVLALAKKLNVLAHLKETGEFNPAEETFVGGLGRKLEKSVRALSNPVSAGALGLAGAATGFLPHTPAALGTAGTAWLAARAIDKAMDSRSPVRAFVKRFGDNTPPAARRIRVLNKARG